MQSYRCGGGTYPIIRRVSDILKTGKVCGSSPGDKTCLFSNCFPCLKVHYLLQLPPLPSQTQLQRQQSEVKLRQRLSFTFDRDKWKLRISSLGEKWLERSLWSDIQSSSRLGFDVVQVGHRDRPTFEQDHFLGRGRDSDLWKFFHRHQQVLVWGQAGWGNSFPWLSGPPLCILTLAIF